jgi:hypothetical protein
MGGIVVHEFTTVEGVFEAPAWTFEFGFAATEAYANGTVHLTYKG